MAAVGAPSPRSAKTWAAAERIALRLSSLFGFAIRLSGASIDECILIYTGAQARSDIWRADEGLADTLVDRRIVDALTRLKIAAAFSRRPCSLTGSRIALIVEAERFQTYPS